MKRIFVALALALNANACAPAPEDDLEGEPQADPSGEYDPEAEAAGGTEEVELGLAASFMEERVVDGLRSPTALAFAPDGRIFVAEQGGAMRVVQGGALAPRPLLQVAVNAQGERGLIGVAVDPDWKSRAYVYVHYTATTPQIHNRVSRFPVNGDSAGKEEVLLDLDPVGKEVFHNGGALHAASDGLYIGIGDNKNGGNSQNRGSLFGKVLRIPRTGLGGAARASSVWALGLRNPFTFAVGPGGRLFINDVGNNRYEEINEGRQGGNYGWDQNEGPAGGGFISPVYAYPYKKGSACSITGGAFYPNDGSFGPEYAGDYFFVDYCGGIRRLDGKSMRPEGEAFATGLGSPVGLAVGPDRALYYLARKSGSLRRIVKPGAAGGGGGGAGGKAEAPGAPVIKTQPQDRSSGPGGYVTFSVEAQGGGTLQYQWQRSPGGASPPRWQDIEGATEESFLIENVQARDDGSLFRVQVRNEAGAAPESRAARLAIKGPTIVFTDTPAVFQPGRAVAYGVTARDSSNRPINQIEWEVVFHHDAHTHPFGQRALGSAGGNSFTPRGPDPEHKNARVWYRIHATARANDESTSVFHDVRPM